MVLSEGACAADSNPYLSGWRQGPGLARSLCGGGG
jgi:hypothetical protein